MAQRAFDMNLIRLYSTRQQDRRLSLASLQHDPMTPSVFTQQQEACRLLTHGLTFTAVYPQQADSAPHTDTSQQERTNKTNSSSIPGT